MVSEPSNTASVIADVIEAWVCRGRPGGLGPGGRAGGGHRPTAGRGRGQKGGNGHPGTAMSLAPGVSALPEGMRARPG